MDLGSHAKAEHCDGRSSDEIAVVPEPAMLAGQIQWLKGWIMGVWVAALAGIGAAFHLLTRGKLRAIWKRGCMGPRWKREYPTAKAQEIREFLDLFVDAFALPRRHRLALSPDDRVCVIYAAIYPIKGMPDALEYESLVDDLQRRYGLSATEVRWEGVTLGELFELARTTEKL